MYKWYSDVRRYREVGGRFVSEQRVKSHVIRTSGRFAENVYDRTLDLVHDFNQDRFSEWSKTLRRELQDCLNGMAVIALGGSKAATSFATENAPVWAAVGLAIANQLRWFDNFMFGVVAGTVEVNDAMATRAAMYPLAGYSTYENAVRIREVVAAGFNEEQRILGSTNPCEVCIEQANLGWQPIGTLRHIGDSPCRGRCYCHFIYRVRPEE